MPNQDDHQKAIRTIADVITRAATDQGRIVEFGFRAMMQAAFPNATLEQKHQLRMAFFAGAQHLWGTMMSLLEAGSEATDKELLRMSMIDKELKEFIEEFKQHIEK